jgi:hypothetical protein
LARRLHTQLRNTLYLQLNDTAQDNAVQEFTNEARQDLLKFLQTGQISWKYLSDHNTSAHKKLLLTVLDDKLSGDLLSSLISDQRQLARLIRQFDTASLFGILRRELRTGQTIIRNCYLTG